MTEQADRPDTEGSDAKDAAEITDTGAPSARRVTPMRVLLGAAVLIALGASAFLTLGRPAMGTDIVLHDAFVRGAVSQIGTDDDARITELHVTLGEAVLTGDRLIDLSSARLQARRATLQARIDGIEAELQETRARHDMAAARGDTLVPAALLERDVVAASLAKARAQVDLLEERVARKTELAESGYASDARLSTDETELDRARAEVTRLTAKLGAADLAIERARLDADADPVRQAERDGIAAILDQAKSELAELDLRIDRRTLTALDAGVVVDVPARPGASVGTDDPILSIWDPAQTWMLAWVDQDHVGRIRVGDRATIHVDSVAQPIAGRVRRILVASNGEEQTLPGQPVSPLLQDNSRFSVHVEFDASGLEHQILPGMSGSVTITPSGTVPKTSPLADLADLFASYSPH